MVRIMPILNFLLIILFLCDIMVSVLRLLYQEVIQIKRSQIDTIESEKLKQFHNIWDCQDILEK